MLTGTYEVMGSRYKLRDWVQPPDLFTLKYVGLPP